MRKLKRFAIATVLLSMLFAFNAMANYNPELPQQTPQNEIKYDDQALNYYWTWLDDGVCVRFKPSYANVGKSVLVRQYNYGLLSRWGKYNEDNIGVPVQRDTYSGKWSQSADGIWSFTFDDCTIPVGVTKIDSVLYAFNGYGELREGYKYYMDLKTDADGLVKADSAELTQWLATQYLPECTSHD